MKTNQLNRSMKKQAPILAAIALSFTGIASIKTAQADSAFAVARDPGNHKQVLRYAWSTGGNERSTYDRDADCLRSLRNEGYTDTARLVFKDSKLDSGYFVIVQSSYTYGSDHHHTMGAGAGTTYAQALDNALDCLSTYDWTWNKRKHGYRVVQNERF